MAFDPAVEASAYVVRRTQLTVTSVASLVVRANPSRVALCIGFGLSAAAVNVDTVPTVTTAIGWQVPTQGPLILTFENVGPLVAFEWYAITAAPSLILIVQEVLYQPRG